MLALVLAMTLLDLTTPMPAAAPAPLQLRVEPVHGRAPFSEEAFYDGSITFRVTLRNVSDKPIIVETELENALHIQPVIVGGKPLGHTGTEAEPYRENPDSFVPHDHAGTLAPGASISAVVPPCSHEWHGLRIEQRTYKPLAPGRFTIVFEYRVRVQATDIAFKEPIVGNPATATLTKN